MRGEVFVPPRFIGCDPTTYFPPFVVDFIEYFKKLMAQKLTRRFLICWKSVFTVNRSRFFFVFSVGMCCIEILQGKEKRLRAHFPLYGIILRTHLGGRCNEQFYVSFWGIDCCHTGKKNYYTVMEKTSN